MIEKSRLPIITLILIIANLFASFAVAFDPELVMDFGFNPRRPSFLTIFSGLFLHQNLLHLLGNMVFLAAVGAAVELATGSLQFWEEGSDLSGTSAAEWVAQSDGTALWIHL